MHGQGHQPQPGTSLDPVVEYLLDTSLITLYFQDLQGPPPPPPNSRDESPTPTKKNPALEDLLHTSSPGSLRPRRRRVRSLSARANPFGGDSGNGDVDGADEMFKKLQLPLDPLKEQPTRPEGGRTPDRRQRRASTSN